MRFGEYCISMFAFNRNFIQILIILASRASLLAFFICSFSRYIEREAVDISD